MGNIWQLDTADFIDFVADKGEQPDRYLRRIGRCPNSSHGNGMGNYQPSPSCPLCGGVGEIFEEQNLAVLFQESPSQGMLLLVNAATSKSRPPMKLDTAAMQCTYLPTDYRMFEGDRLLLNSRDAWYNQNLYHDLGSKGSTSDLLRYWPVLEIGSVYNGNTHAKASPLAYTISADQRSIVFASGASSGDPLSIEFRYRPQWVVLPDQHIRRVEPRNGGRFPNRCYLAQWEGLDTDTTAANA